MYLVYNRDKSYVSTLSHDMPILFHNVINSLVILLKKDTLIFNRYNNKKYVFKILINAIGDENVRLKKYPEI